MKTQALILSGVVTLTAVVTSTVAAVSYFQSQPPAIEQQKTDDAISVERTSAGTASKPATPTTSNNPAPEKPQPAQPAPDTDFPHWRIKLVDETNQSADFAQFFDRVKKAVRDRDAQFIRSIVTDQTKFSFGEHRSISYLNPENPNSPFWAQLEKSLALGCTQEADFFSCPTTFRQFDQAIQDAPRDQEQTAYETSIIVVGQNVNVRSQPDTKATAIAALTNEIVRFDSRTFEQASEQDRAETFNLSNLKGWTPVILPNNKRGFVSNRFAYSPIGYRVLFAKENGKWIMQAFVTGD